MTQASISWRLRFSLVTDVEYTLTAIPQLQRKKRGQVSTGELALIFSRKESRSWTIPRGNGKHLRPDSLAVSLLEKGYQFIL